MAKKKLEFKGPKKLLCEIDKNGVVELEIILPDWYSLEELDLDTEVDMKVAVYEFVGMGVIYGPSQTVLVMDKI